MKIEDNFLDQKEFDELEGLMMWPDFAWGYCNRIDTVEDADDFMFVHLFYFNHAPTSSCIEKLNPIVDIINPISLCRIKANLLTRTPEIVENSFHTDMGVMSEEQQKQWTTSIFYVNTNNGYTKFEDGTKVESVANRMVTFPSNMKHTGTSCTDKKMRIVVNFNYFKQ